MNAEHLEIVAFAMTDSARRKLISSLTTTPTSPFTKLTIPSKEAHFPVTLGGFKMGDCSVDGYTVANGTKHECSPKVLGKQWCADFELFAKTQHFKENLKAGCGFACKSHSDCNGGECGVCNKYGQCWYDATM